MNVQEIDTPALLFSSDYRSVEFISDKNLLTVTNKLGLKKGVVLGNFVVDSSGRLFKTIKAMKQKNYYPFWKFEFFNPLIYIELELERIEENFDLDGLKDKVLKIISRDKDNWVNYDNFDKIKASFKKAETHHELIEVIGSYIK